MLEQIPSLLKLKSYLTVSQLVKKYFKNAKIQSAFSIHPLLVGGNPFNTTSIYALIHFLERNWGVHFCIGGTGKIIEELKQLMIRNDIKIKVNVNITKVNLDKKSIISVEDQYGNTYKCDKLIFNGDPPTFYDEILRKN